MWLEGREEGRSGCQRGGPGRQGPDKSPKTSGAKNGITRKPLSWQFHFQTQPTAVRPADEGGSLSADRARRFLTSQVLRSHVRVYTDSGRPRMDSQDPALLRVLVFLCYSFEEISFLI